MTTTTGTVVSRERGSQDDRGYPNNGTPTAALTRSDAPSEKNGLNGSIQLWSYNYDPEPTGIAPVSRTLVRGLSSLGWDVTVVAAHPHYPEPIWGTRVRPYRETRDGVDIVRLPLWAGRATTGQRIRQELSFTAALQAAAPVLGPPLMEAPDAIVVASPSFPALLPAIVNTRLRRVPWLLWLHDLLPDGASATGQLEDDGLLMRLSRRLERAAYRSADRIVTLSHPFTVNLLDKGVPEWKISLIYNTTTRGFVDAPGQDRSSGRPRIVCMGNIGHSQGLAPLVAAFERAAPDATLVITGTGVAEPDVRAEVRSDRVQMLGVVSDEELERELRTATLGLVTQSYDGTEFNLPSKLMNYMAYGLPVIGAVNPAGEVARLVAEARAGWVADSSRPDELPSLISEILAQPEELDLRARRGYDYARARFCPSVFAKRFDQTLIEMVDPHLRHRRNGASSNGRH
jgi:colanic acid biosynthesis glycosyl transferase WcaI